MIPAPASAVVARALRLPRRGRAARVTSMRRSARGRSATLPVGSALRGWEAFDMVERERREAVKRERAAAVACAWAYAAIAT